MALKPKYNVVLDDVSYHVDEVAAKGGMMSLSTAASGVGLDDSLQLATYASTGSGVVPVGVLMTNVVDIDVTRQHKNWYNEEAVTGDKVALGRIGWVDTDMITGTPAAGNTAYVGANGNFTPDTSGGDVAVGKFATSKNEDGFARVQFNLT